MKIELPKQYRPECSYYRKCQPGIDVPSIFYDNLQGIDENLYLVWHQYRLLWDTIINDVHGSLEDPRHIINVDHGHLNFGFVLTDRTGAPILEQTMYNKTWKPTTFGAWHLWRFCKPASGWAHILKLDSTEGDYLHLVTERLYLQARWTDRYGFRSYNGLLESAREQDKEQIMKDKQEMMQAFQTENRWFMKKAMSNFESGVTRPTNPQKEIITSYSGQGNKNRIIRPATDKELNIWTPDQ